MIALAPQIQTQPEKMPLLVMLGTGTPSPNPERYGPAAAVVFEGKSYLIDCGAGIVRRCTLAATRHDIPALKAPNLQTVFVTHLHSDHTVGYPDLILTPWVVGRSTPLAAYGPKGLKRMTRLILDAYREDIDIRTKGLEQEKPEGARVDVHEVRAGVIFKGTEVQVTAFPVKHGSWKEAFGYRFDVGGKTIVISGDTAPCQALIDAAQNADILVHEVYPAEELVPENRPGGDKWPDYMKSFHTSAHELGQIASLCHVKLLVLTHVVRKTATDERLVSEVREGGYQGRVVVAKDLDTFTP